MAAHLTQSETNAGSGDVISHINVTPLVDVLLVLLLVLMVSASAAVARALDVSLPRAASGGTPSSTLTVHVERTGALRIGELALAPESLRQKVVELGAPEAVSVLIAADGAAEHRHVIALMDLLAAARVTRIAFAVQAPERAR